MELGILKELVIIFGFATVVNLTFQRLNIPNIVGFLLTGIIIGPGGFGLVAHSHEIEVLAEIGVIFLLFTIGIEFSIKNLVKIRRIVLLGGSLQVFLSIGVAFLLLHYFNLPWQQAVFGGFLAALSSTAIVMKSMQERAEVDSLQGKASLGILIFQDIIIVPMILIIPLLAGETANMGQQLLLMLGKAVGLIVVMYLLSRFVVPRLLHEVARTQSHELFLLTILVLVFAIAWLTSSLGLSLALGAFMAGLTVSESAYSNHAFGNIIPFRDIFTAFFFVSIGMLLDLEFLASHLVLVLTVTLLVIVVKTIITGGVAFLLGFPFKTTVLIGMILSQIGEFSFILSTFGMEHGLLKDFHYQLFLSVTIVSMGVTPFIIMAAKPFANLLVRLPIPKKMLSGLRSIEEPQVGNLEKHIIVAGMGVNGHNIARAAKIAGIPYIIIEMDPEIVREEQEKGEPVFFGDASHTSTLNHAKITGAEVLVISMANAAATYTIVNEARQMNPKLHIIVRTRYLEDMDDLYKAGANEVIPEEFETSVEIFSRVLNKYLVPKDEIEKLVTEMRAGGYEVFRQLALPERNLDDLKIDLPNIELSTLRVSEKTPISGKTLADLDLRNAYGVTLLAIRRDDKTVTNPGPETAIYAHDILVLLGKQYDLACANELFKEEQAPSC